MKTARGPARPRTTRGITKQIVGPSIGSAQATCKRDSAAAIRTRITPIELLDVEVFLSQTCVLRMSPLCRAQVALVSRIAAPVANPTPYAVCEPLHATPVRRATRFCELLHCCWCSHQSSPCATPVNPGAHCVATYGASCKTGWARRLSNRYHWNSASMISTATIAASTAVTTASRR